MRIFIYSKFSHFAHFIVAKQFPFIFRVIINIFFYNKIILKKGKILLLLKNNN
jgi:hypothetical protein